MGSSRGARIRNKEEAGVSAKDPTLCEECGRPRPQSTPSEPAVAIMHCAACLSSFSLDEIETLFDEANVLDSNAARQLRRVIVDDLIAALRRHA